MDKVLHWTNLVFLSALLACFLMVMIFHKPEYKLSDVEIGWRHGGWRGRDDMDGYNGCSAVGYGSVTDSDFPYCEPPTRGGAAGRAGQHRLRVRGEGPFAGRQKWPLRPKPEGFRTVRFGGWLCWQGLRWSSASSA